MIVVALVQLPELEQFEPSGCLDLVTGKLTVPEGIETMKAGERSQWTIAGRDRLVKVRPGIAHDRNMLPDFHVPPAKGAPQWFVKVPLRAKVVAVVKDYPNGRFVPYDAL
jgi:hypothetical protein